MREKTVSILGHQLLKPLLQFTHKKESSSYKVMEHKSIKSRIKYKNNNYNQKCHMAKVFLVT